MIRRLSLLLLITLAVTPTLLAQAPSPLDAAAETITAGDMGSKITLLAHDSLMGRDTPSPGLERAAEYVIGEFRRLGLRPMGESGSYVQRFGLSRWTLDLGASSLEVAAGSTRSAVTFARDVRAIAGAVSGEPLTGEAVLVTGPLRAGISRHPALRDRVILIVPDYSRPLPDDLGDRVDELARTARAVLVISNRDSAAFARRVSTSVETRLTPDFREQAGGPPILEVRERALAAVLATARLDLALLRASDTTAVRPLPAVRVTIRLVRHVLAQATAPNIVGVLDGRDSRLRGEYVAVSAHLDHIGVRGGGTDSIFNGADDNASGVAALLEIAEAFSRAEARPARSLLFLVPSGEEKGLWGSRYFVEHPTVPLRQVMADLNMDLIGRNWTDSVIVSGLELSSLGETVARTAAAHPALRMSPLADRWPEERIFYRSDHYHFAVKGVPVLFFTSGTHGDYHQPTDAADRIDSEKAARLARLVFYTAAAVGEAAERPRWHQGRTAPGTEAP